ncbi:hypothetical protein MNB_SV-5-1310 [hydrothermal vent metagenome]|uniref:Cytochrome c domain-containing protein n=1 Tax=hydrothermal vent metagenome TaxID=652676 RepID=A0A1W1EBQ2_9ZZZZ
MLKNGIVGLLVAFVIGVGVWTASKGGPYNGGEHGKVIENIGSNTVTKSAQIEDKDDRQKEDDKLKALRDKAGNAGAFEVSQAYKSKCSSCHGVNGTGFQNGKPMMGPKLIGQTSEEIFKKLVEFKSGRKENVVMKGLLMHLDEDALKEFADEIGEFPARAAAAK